MVNLTMLNPVLQKKYFAQQSDRLVFRKLVPSDIEAWVSFFVDNPSLKFLGLDLSQDASTMAKGWINRQFERYEKDGLGHLAVIEKSTGQMIGNAGILVRKLEGKTVYEIAYSLKPNAWGKGYGTEAARQLKKFGLDHQISNRYISIIDKENAASIRVAEKNGMSIINETTFMGMEVFVFAFEKQ